MGNFLKNLHPLLRRKKNPNDNKDPNFAIIDMFNEELNTIEQDTIDSKIQSSLKTSTGKYLDIYGDWYGLVRKNKENDNDYRERIIEYVLLKRGTNNSIIDAIRRFLEDEDVYVDIYEPFKNIFYTNKSHLNGEDHLMGDYYRFAIIDITIGKTFPLSIIEEINKFKPAGVKIYFTYDGSHGMSEDKLITSVFYKGFPKVTTYQDIDIFRGYGRILYGHLNLGIAKVNDITDVFKTNNSLINSLDVLSGSATVGREFYNYTYKTQDSYIPRMSDFVTSISIEENNVLGEELSKDFYTDTISRNSLSPSEYIEGNDHKTILYFNFDTNEYIRRKGINISTLDLNEKELREYVSNYFGNVSLDFDIQAMVSPSRPVKTNLSIYDFISKSWVTISKESINLMIKNIGNKIGNLVDYLNNNLAIFIRLEIEPLKEETELRINYLDLNFKRHEKDIYTVKPFSGKVEGHQETIYFSEADATKDINIDNGDIITKSGYQPMQYLRLTDGYDNNINRNLIYDTENNIKNKEDTKGNYKQYWFIYINEAHKYFSVGDYITISFDVDMDRGDILRVYDSNHNSDFMFGSVIFEDIGDGKQRLQFTRKLKEATKDTPNWQLAFFADDNGDNFSIKNIKVEKGETATPYQPNPEDLYGANNPNQYVELQAKDVDGNIINSKDEPETQDEVKFLDKIIKFYGVHNNIQTISVLNSIDLNKVYLETSIYGDNYKRLKTLTNIKSGETHTDNDLVDLFGIKNLTYQTLNPFSEVIIRPFLNYSIEKLMEDIGTIVDLPSGFFNAVWQETDSYIEHKNPTPIVLDDVYDGTIDNSTGDIWKVPTPVFSTYTDVDNYRYNPIEYTRVLTLDSRETIGKLKNTRLDTKKHKVSNKLKVTMETEVEPYNTVIKNSFEPQTIKFSTPAKYPLTEPIEEGTNYKAIIRGSFREKWTQIDIKNSSHKFIEKAIYPAEKIREDLIEIEFKAKSETSTKQREDKEIWVSISPYEDEETTITSFELVKIK